MMFWKTGCNCLLGCIGKAARKHRESFVTTETKYIFPKQPQSMAVLVFIIVLIVLLLVLTVMVHMRNRKLKSILEEQMAERRQIPRLSIMLN